METEAQEEFVQGTVSEGNCIDSVLFLKLISGIELDP
jgi:hypothetical protein